MRDETAQGEQWGRILAYLRKPPNPITLPFQQGLLLKLRFRRTEVIRQSCWGKGLKWNLKKHFMWVKRLAEHNLGKGKERL